MKYGTFLFVQWKWNSGNREAHWRTRFLLSEVHRNVLHKETWNIWKVLPRGTTISCYSILAGKNLLRRNPCDMIGIMKILLNAINAKYIHSNLAVYSLTAYAKDYQDQIVIGEYTINNRVDYILEQIYKAKPDVLCFSCYIWNIAYVKELIEELKRVI